MFCEKKYLYFIKYLSSWVMVRRSVPVTSLPATILDIVGHLTFGCNLDLWWRDFRSHSKRATGSDVAVSAVFIPPNHPLYLLTYFEMAMKPVKKSTELALYTEIYSLTHWSRVTHICVGNLAIIVSDNGLSPGRRQTIIWTKAGILLIGSLGTSAKSHPKFIYFHARKCVS